ncbi:MAG TPA: protein-disulfide reductase DsbD domain-containing protein, partial [Methylophilaceae bacterium]|nr:protein-disulfide reductase DsbD domain-containing protein [Methylophilaceae bacterium]
MLVSLRACLFALCLLPVLAQPAMAEGFSGSGKQAFLADDNDTDILPPDEAFKVSLQMVGENTLHADFKIAPGHYLYRDRFKFELIPADSVGSAAELPQGEPKKDPTFGVTQVFHKDVTAVIRLMAQGKLPDDLKLQATYQGCSEKGLCYSPIRKILSIPQIGIISSAVAASAEPAVSGSEQDEAARLLKDGSLWLVIAGFFGFGLLLSLTPCVLPMIPILSGIIVGARPRSKLQSFGLSLSYVLGMAVAYSLAGIAAGFSGQLLSASLQSPAVIFITAVIFVLLALSMFGFYELKLPAAFEDRMVNISNR